MEYNHGGETTVWVQLCPVTDMDTGVSGWCWWGVVCVVLVFVGGVTCAQKFPHRWIPEINLNKNGWPQIQTCQLG